jgi:hypothetical protein
VFFPYSGVRYTTCDSFSKKNMKFRSCRLVCPALHSWPTMIELVTKSKATLATKAHPHLSASHLNIGNSGICEEVSEDYCVGGSSAPYKVPSGRPCKPTRPMENRLA